MHFPCIACVGIIRIIVSAKRIDGSANMETAQHLMSRVLQVVAPTLKQELDECREMLSYFILV